jgi:hypothetical protein
VQVEERGGHLPPPAVGSGAVAASGDASSSKIAMGARAA